MNYTELATELSRNTDTVYRRLKALFPLRKFAASTELLPDEIEAVRDYYSAESRPRFPVRKSNSMGKLAAERAIKKYFHEMEAAETTEPTEAVADMAAEKSTESVFNFTEVPYKSVPESSAGWIEQLRDYVGGSDFVFITMLICMVAQAFHTAAFFIKVSPAEPEWVSWAFAAAVDLTALVMTMHKARRGYLIGFAVFHFVANIFVKCPEVEIESGILIFIGQWLGVVVVSGILAFSNFSYTELFTTKIAKK